MLALAVLLALLAQLCGCAGESSVTVVRPTTAFGAIGSMSADPGDTAPQTEPQVVLSVQDLNAEPEITEEPAPAFHAAFALHQSGIFSRLADGQVYAFSPDAQPVSLPAPALPWTGPLAAALPAQALPIVCTALSEQLVCLASAQGLTLADENGQSAFFPFQPLPQAPDAAVCDLIASGTALGVVFASGQAADARTWLAVYDLSDPAQPVLCAVNGLDGVYDGCTVRSGLFHLVTRFAPQPDTLRLPCLYTAAGPETIEPAQVILPDETNAAVFTLLAAFSPADGSCAGWFAAGGSCQVCPDDTGVLLCWTQSGRSRRFWEESVYQVTETTDFLRSGLARLRLSDGRWRIAAAGAVEGVCRLLSPLDGSWCLVTDLNADISADYYDPEYDWSLTQAGTAPAGSRLYLLDSSLRQVGTLALSETESVSILGLQDTLLYYRTAEDGLLRAAGLASLFHPIAAPLAEIGAFRDLVILEGGVAAALTPTDGQDPQSPSQLVLLNLSNPSHITRKYLTEPDAVFPPDTRFVQAAGSGKSSLTALCSGQSVWLCNTSYVYGPRLLNTLQADTAELCLLENDTLACLSGPGGLALFHADGSPIQSAP